MTLADLKPFRLELEYVIRLLRCHRIHLFKLNIDKQAETMDFSLLFAIFQYTILFLHIKLQNEI